MKRTVYAVIATIAIIIAASLIPSISRHRLFAIAGGLATCTLSILLVVATVRAITRKNAPLLEKKYGRWRWWGRYFGLTAILVAITASILPNILLRRSSVYKLAVSTAHQRPEFVRALGAPIRQGWFNEATATLGDNAQTRLAIPVIGSERDGRLIVFATKSNGEWTIKQLELEVSGSAPPIRLLDSTPLD